MIGLVERVQWMEFVLGYDWSTSDWGGWMVGKIGRVRTKVG